MVRAPGQIVLSLLAVAGAAAAARAQVPAGGAFRVNTFTTNGQMVPRVALNPSGEFVVTWLSLQQLNWSFSIHGRRYLPDGTATGVEFRADSSDVGSEPVTALGANGTFVVFWDNYTYQTHRSSINGRQFKGPGTPLGQEFQVDASTTSVNYRSEVAAQRRSGYIVTWSQYDVKGPALPRIRGRRYDAFGAARGAEFLVNVPEPNVTGLFSDVAVADDGRFVMTWKEFSSSARIMARLYEPSGAPLGQPFVVEPVLEGGYGFNTVAMGGDGGFLVAWDYGLSGFHGVEGRAFSPAGVPLGPRFEVPATFGTDQRIPRAAASRRGDFVVAWTRYIGLGSEVMARRFTSAGAPRGDEFRVASATTAALWASDVASDEVGNFVVAWSGRDGSSYGAFAQRFGGLIPAALAVDTAPSARSDGNGVLEPGETVDVRPSWRNVNGSPQAFTGALTLFGGPPGPTHTLSDASASYGTVADGATASCTDCYALGVSGPATRPALEHWDGVIYEDLAPDAQGQKKSWRVHVGDSFTDVPRASPYYRFVETMLHNFITNGCAPVSYCPGSSTTRAEMATFVLLARNASGDAPPACGVPRFTDVPAADPFCRWIEQLAREGVVTGCAGGSFCPSDPVTREQMAVFALRTLDPSLVPPDCTTPVFADVPAASPFCRWVEELARRGVVAGCGGGNFCPQDPVSREQMAVFVSVTYGLRLYGTAP